MSKNIIEKLFTRKSSRHTSGIHNKGNKRPSLEPLEDRTVPAVTLPASGVLADLLIVSNAAGDGITISGTDDSITVEADNNNDGSVDQTENYTGVKTITVEGNGGNDQIDASGVVSVGVTVNGGGGNDTIIGSLADDLLDGGGNDDMIFGGEDDLANLFAADPSAILSIPYAGGTGLTSDGVLTIGSTTYSVWRLRNGNSTDQPTTLKAVTSGSPIVFDGTLPANTQTFLLSPFPTATHIMNPGQTKAAGPQTFSRLVSGNDTMNGSTGADEFFGQGGNDVVIGDSFNELTNDTLDGGIGNDTVELQANHDLNGFNDASANVVNFEALTGTGVTEVKGLNNSDGDVFNFDGVTITNIKTFNLRGGDDFIDLSNAIEGDSDKGYVIKGGSNTDTIIGSSDSDDIDGEGGNDHIDAGKGNDTIQASSGADDINAGSGNDRIIVHGNPGIVLDDDIDGSSGFDTVEFQNDVDVNLINAGGGFGGFDNIEKIEYTSGTAGDLKGRNDATGDVFDLSGVQMVGATLVRLRGGNDTVKTSTSHSTLTTYQGGSGTDEITLTFTPSQLAGFSSSDFDAIEAYLANPTSVMTVTAVNVVLATVNMAVDTTFENAFVAVMIGNECFDITDCLDKNIIIGSGTINGTSGDDLIIGSAGPDTIDAMGGNDCIFAGPGNDTITGGSGDDKILAGAGNDVINVQGLDALHDVIDAGPNGGGRGDELVNTGGTLTLKNLNFGNIVGFEFFDGNGGVLRGTNSTDADNTFDFSSINVSNNTLAGVEMQGGNDTVIGAKMDSLTYDLGAGEDSFTGTNNVNDEVLGGSNNDTINTGGGNDTVNGGGGADVIGTGSGNDEIQVSGQDALDDEVDGGTGNDDVINLSGTLILRNINSGIFASGHVNNIEFIGGAGTKLRGTIADANYFDLSNVNVSNAFTTVEMQDGADTVIGAGQDDLTYDLGSGADSFTGTGSIRDEVIGGSGDDTIATGAGNDSVILTTGDADDITLGAGNDKIFTTGQAALGDIIDAGSTSESFNGDELINTGGGFFLTGLNDGTNVFGIELLDGNGQVLKGTNSTSPNNTFDFSAINVSNGTLAGIDMQGGNDTVIGAPDDNLAITLGSGADTFFPFNDNSGTDTITDFEDGTDKIDLTAFGIMFDDLTVTQSGDDTVIELPNGKEIRLLDFDADDLDATDFLGLIP